MLVSAETVAVAAGWRRAPDWGLVESELRPEPGALALAIIGAARLVRPRLSALLEAAVDLQEHEAMILLGLGIGGPRLRTGLARLLQSDGAAVGRSARVVLGKGLVAEHPTSGSLSLSASGTEAFAALVAILLEFERTALVGVKSAKTGRARSALCAAHAATAQTGGAASLAPADVICGRLLFQLILTSRLVSRIAADLIGANGSRPPFEARILAELSAGPLSQSVLAHRLGSDKGQLSRTIGTMARNGLVQIERASRRRILSLTSGGQRACRRFAAKLATLEDGYRARIDQEGRAALIGVLDRIASNLR